MGESLHPVLVEYLSPILQFTTEKKTNEYVINKTSYWYCLECDTWFEDDPIHHDVYCVIEEKFKSDLEIVEEVQRISNMQYLYRHHCLPEIVDKCLRQLSSYIVQHSDHYLLGLLLQSGLHHRVCLFCIENILHKRCDSIVRELNFYIPYRCVKYVYQYILKYDTVDMIYEWNRLQPEAFLYYLFYSDKIHLYKELFKNKVLTYDDIKKHLKICEDMSRVKNGTICFYKYLSGLKKVYDTEIHKSLEKKICRDVINEIIKFM